jgi:hypothetical protein
MVESKHITIIKNGLEYLLRVVALLKDEMLRMKVFGMERGVDLAREERVRRMDLLVQRYLEIHQSSRVRKLVEKNEETNGLAEKLIN